MRIPCFLLLVIIFLYLLVQEEQPIPMATKASLGQQLRLAVAKVLSVVLL